ncbi:MAG TPA: CBS domain-containing protein [candidate division WOR-3 bacterium]|uniref:CBS domain-containing protein n=1 Tax=candidate division WOR-3 bacterium TaxID=2052148 RepID=A0A9C9EMI9_UNCW3|nr:CBS domain-containing protein [candidate division WOR-3 bacterium]
MEKVRKITCKKVITVQRYTTLRKILMTFKKFHTFPLVPVVEEENLLVGIISLKNLIDVFRPEEPEILKTIPFLDEKPIEITEIELSPEMGQLIVAEDIMNTKFLAIDEDLPIKEAFRLMRLHNREQLPVINKEKKFIGFVGLFDVVMSIFKSKGVV